MDTFITLIRKTVTATGPLKSLFLQGCCRSPFRGHLFSKNLTYCIIFQAHFHHCDGWKSILTESSADFTCNNNRISPKCHCSDYTNVFRLLSLSVKGPEVSVSKEGSPWQYKSASQRILLTIMPGKFPLGNTMACNGPVCSCCDTMILCVLYLRWSGPSSSIEKPDLQLPVILWLKEIKGSFQYDCLTGIGNLFNSPVKWGGACWSKICPCWATFTWDLTF